MACSKDVLGAVWIIKLVMAYSKDVSRAVWIKNLVYGC